MIALDLALQQLRARPWQPMRLSEPVAIDRLPTPALLLDVDAFERNLDRMARFLVGHGKGYRPHAKTHKCPIIAARQLERGAVGVCAAKVSEAVALINAGIDRVLVTSPVTDPDKARLLVELAREAAALDVVVDSEQGLTLLQQAAGAPSLGGAAGIGVLVDVDVAMGRTGTRELDVVLRLAEGAMATPGLHFRGIQHYAGQVMHIEGYQARRSSSLALWEVVQGMVDALAARGLAPGIVTGAGTGTYDIDCDVACLTDLQVGSYIFMDQQYRVTGGRQGPAFDDFETALQVLVTAISRPRDGLVTVDGGYKAFASDAGNPVPVEPAGFSYRFAGDEHGVLIRSAEGTLPALGARARFAAPHCDPTVNLYDWYWACRDGYATELWPITGRGCSW